MFVCFTFVPSVKNLINLKQLVLLYYIFFHVALHEGEMMLPQWNRLSRSWMCASREPLLKGKAQYG